MFRNNDIRMICTNFSITIKESKSCFAVCQKHYQGLVYRDTAKVTEVIQKFI